MSLLSPAAVYVPLRGRRGFGRRGRRGRRGVFYAGEEEHSDEFSDAEGSFDEDAGEWFEEDEAGERYIDEPAQVGRVYVPDNVEASANAAPAAPTENFITSMMAKHGMVGHPDPDAHPSSQKLMPYKAAGDTCYDEPVVVLECVEVTPCEPQAKPKCAPEPECDESSESSEECEPKCVEKTKDVTFEDDGKEEPDYTLAYDCWVSKGEKTKPTKKASPDDCDPKPPKNQCKTDYENMRAALADAMHNGKDFSADVKTQILGVSDKAERVTQKMDIALRGSYKKKAYTIAVEIAPLDENGQPIASLAASAPLIKVKKDENGQFRARAVESAIKKLQKKKTPLAAIKHTMMTVQGLVE